MVFSIQNVMPGETPPEWKPYREWSTSLAWFAEGGMLGLAELDGGDPIYYSRADLLRILPAGGEISLTLNEFGGVQVMDVTVTRADIEAATGSNTLGSHYVEFIGGPFTDPGTGNQLDSSIYSQSTAMGAIGPVGAFSDFTLEFRTNDFPKIHLYPTGYDSIVVTNSGILAALDTDNDGAVDTALIIKDADGQVIYQATIAEMQAHQAWLNNNSWAQSGSFSEQIPHDPNTQIQSVPMLGSFTSGAIVYDSASPSDFSLSGLVIEGVSAAASQFPFAGDYPLADIMDHYNVGMTGRTLSRLGTTQMKTRLHSGSPQGSVPRTRDNSLLPEGFISAVKQGTIQQAFDGTIPGILGVKLLNADEYAILTEPAANGGYGFDANDSGPNDPTVAKLQEVPLTMMKDSYRASIARLLDRDEAMYFDASIYQSAMLPKTGFTGSTYLSPGPTLIATHDAEVASDLDADGSMFVMGDLKASGNGTVGLRADVMGNAAVGGTLTAGTAPAASDYVLTPGIAGDQANGIFPTVYDAANKVLKFGIKPDVPKRDGSDLNAEFFLNGAAFEGVVHQGTLQSVADVGEVYVFTIDTTFGGLAPEYVPAIGDYFEAVVEPTTLNQPAEGSIVRMEGGPMNQGFFMPQYVGNFIMGMSNLIMSDPNASHTFAKAVWLQSNFLVQDDVAIGTDLDVGGNLDQETGDPMAAVLRDLVTINAALLVSDVFKMEKSQLPADAAKPEATFNQTTGAMDLDATGLIHIESDRDQAVPDTDPDVVIDATAGSVKLAAQEIIVEADSSSSSSEIKLDDEVTVEDELTIQTTVAAGTSHDAFKMINNSLTKVRAYIDNSSGTPTGNMVFANMGTSPDDAHVSIGGNLTVSSNLYIDQGGATPRRIREEGLQVTLEDNIVRLSHESEYLSFEEAHGYSVQATPPAPTPATGAIEAEAVAAANRPDATSWSDLSDREKMASTEGSAVEVRRDAHADYYIPRTHMSNSMADGIQMEFPAGEGGNRALIVKAGHSDLDLDASPDGSTSMSLMSGLLSDIEDSYAALQSGKIVSHSRMKVTGPDGASASTPDWVDVLLQAAAFEIRESAAGQLSLFEKIREFLNYSFQKAGITSSDIGAVQLGEIISALQNPLAASPFAAGTDLQAALEELHGKEYDGPDLFANGDGAKAIWAVVDHSLMKMSLSRAATSIAALGDGSKGNLHVQNSGAVASPLTDASLAMEVLGHDGTSSVLSTIDGKLEQGTSPTKPDLFKYKGVSDANPTLVLDSTKLMTFSHVDDRSTTQLTEVATLNADFSLQAQIDRLLVEDRAIVAGDDEFEAHGTVGLGLVPAGGSPHNTRVYGHLKVEEDSSLKKNIKSGYAYTVSGDEYRTMMLDQLDLFTGTFNRLDSTLADPADPALYRKINTGAGAEFHLGLKDATTKADMLLGGKLALHGPNSEHMLANNDIWFGDSDHKNALKAKSKLKLQDEFTDGSQSYDLTSGTSSPFGYTMVASGPVLSSLLKNGENTIHELSWLEAENAGLGTRPVGANDGDPSGHAFVSVFSAIASAQNAAAGSTALTRLSAFHDMDTDIELSEAYFSQPSSGTNGAVIDDPVMKRRIEVYHNGLRVPDSEYDMIFSAAKPGKLIRLKRPCERRDILVVDTKVPNAG